MTASDTHKPLPLPLAALCIVLMLAPVVALAITWGSLPDTIPAHWGAEGIDRWGSKYELLIVPALGVLLGAVLLFGAHRAGDARVPFLGGSIGERAVMAAACIGQSLIVLGGTVGWIMGAQGAGTPVESLTGSLNLQVLGVPAIFLVAGVLLAIRTINAPEDEPVLGEQYHAQRIAGAIMVVSGVLMSVLSALVVSAQMVQVVQAAIAAVSCAILFVLLKRWL
ncbi:DUF1648 domain-containing protein [Collinsella tanakaei]|uniref:DUF1648 domain-containing protein n=1 Tax=Collinsella tanakaei TaxID=626935 RepID=UPI0025A4A1F4|nr:DUF1648 domain-containing protein [Collinsella tanakaei]MDM8300805.1 DUF1648 domain-containing protein [Collinsella tanakaei]